MNEKTEPESDRERWNQKYARGQGPAHFRPSRLLVEHQHLLADPSRQPADADIGRRALDVACGFGGSALYLASRGYQVDAVDISSVALSQAQAEAQRRGLQLGLVQADLARWWVPPCHYDLIVVRYYLNRDLMPELARGLKPRGLLFLETWNEHALAARPGFDPAYLLHPGELRRFALDAHLDLIQVADGATEDHVSRLIARRPA
jgi:tellurite methyltransferase